METLTKSRKPGRKAEHYRAENGTVINGLARRPSDGRWRIIGTEITFTEADEAMAIRRFRMWQSKQTDDKVALPVTINDINQIGPAVTRAARQQITINVPRAMGKPVAPAKSIYELRSYNRA